MPPMLGTDILGYAPICCFGASLDIMPHWLQAWNFSDNLGHATCIQYLRSEWVRVMPISIYYLHDAMSLDIAAGFNLYRDDLSRHA